MTNFFGRNTHLVSRILFAAVSFACIPAVVQAQLEITEIMYNPEDDFVWEWIEVRNTSGSPIDLDGWLGFNLGDDDDFPTGTPQATIDATRAANTIIPANSVAVIYDGEQAGFSGFPSFEPNDASFRTAWGLSPSVPVIAARFFPQLSNDSDPNDPTPSQSVGFWSSLTNWQSDLVTNPSDPNGPMIVGSFDNTEFSVVYNTGFPNPPEGSSITWRGTGSNQDGTNWRVSAAPQNGVVTSVEVQVVGNINNTDDIGNPGVVPSGSFSTSGLHITEIMYDPASAEPAGAGVDSWEWVEIYNNSGSTIDLAGYVLDDNNSNDHSAANIAAGMIPDGGVAVLYSDALTETQFKDAWGASLNAIAVSGWTSNLMGLNNNAPNDVVGLWSSFASYSGDHVTHANTVANQRFDEDDDFPNTLTNGPSIYLADLDDDPNDGLSWVNAIDGDGLSFFATGVPGTGGMITFHGGDDIGSPGFFEVAPIEDANFDGDEDVDGLDFLIWQRNFGTMGGAGLEDGDANGDGDVDGDDLAIWEDQYGTTGLLQGITAVPEPGTLVLCGLALAPLALRRRRS